MLELEPENTCSDFTAAVYRELVRLCAPLTGEGRFEDLDLHPDDAAARVHDGVLDDKTFAFYGPTCGVEAVVFLQNGRLDGHRPGLHASVKMCRVVADEVDAVQLVGCVPVNDRAQLNALVTRTARMMLGNAL